MMTRFFTAHSYVYLQGKPNRVKKWFLFFLVLLVIILFLPWTQTIRAKGAVTALLQEQRPQQVNTIIGGRIQQVCIGDS